MDARTILEEGDEDLSLAQTVYRRLNQLAAISSDAVALTRLPLTPQHFQAEALVTRWMEEAGLRVRRDAAGNLIGRLEGSMPDASAVVLGSHLDTVVDAGRFDGVLGVVAAIGCVEALVRDGFRPSYAVEVVAFLDEEGVRFGASLVGSRAFAGDLDPQVLRTVDAAGMSLEDAMRGAGLDPARLDEARRTPEEIVAYLEMHIEQGPVLEAEGVPVGVVTAIAGASRFKVTLEGTAGHAGAVPMGQRRDALTGAAECALHVEAVCRSRTDVIGTVGAIDASPGVSNTIPGRASFPVDIRSAHDRSRLAVVEEAISHFHATARRRGLHIVVEHVHEAAAVPCALSVMRRLGDAIGDAGHRVVELASGAGHDAMAVAGLAPIGMLFVRCRNGVSHNPAEFASEADVAVAIDVLTSVLVDLTCCDVLL